MQPPDESALPLIETRETGKRLVLWVRRNRPLAWLICLAVGLILFLLWLPPFVRVFFWHSLVSHGVLSSMTLGFGLLALSLLWSTGQRLDTWTFLLINLRGRHPAWLDVLMWGVTQLGNGMSSVALALTLYFSREHLLAYGLILGTLTLWLVVELVKALVRRGRPFIRLSQTRIVGRRAGGRSFPSGHTSQAFFLATLMAGYFHAGVWLAVLLFLGALLVGITRMYVGAHYPRDVIAGAILGSAWGVLGGIVYGYAL